MTEAENFRSPMSGMLFCCFRRGSPQHDSQKQAFQTWGLCGHWSIWGKRLDCFGIHYEASKRTAQLWIKASFAFN